ncbi:Target of EGR1, member 1 (Nuclear) [Gaertneriomyces sp. JEL0708]|nr:Target of EGR1, member 1 (Nuclear) [Gaertneriomyces sp. JEL0708]
MAGLPELPYTDITRHNVHHHLPQVLQTLSKASHVAIDTEFSGLGGKATRDPNVEDRYSALVQVVRQHALCSIGMSVFEPTGTKDVRQPTYLVHNYNFLVCPETDFTVSPRSMEFLANTGFDIGRMFKDGIAFKPGADFGSANSSILAPLFIHLLHLTSPVILHNGFLDLMFLYHSFYSPLPTQLDMFLSDLTDMFPGGLLDTKYIAEFVQRESRSFLGYLWRKSHRIEERKDDGLKVTIQTPFVPDLTSQGIPSLALNESEVDTETTKVAPGKRRRDDGKPYCHQYANHGFCRLQGACGKSHDLDLILDWEEGKCTVPSAAEPDAKRMKLDGEAETGTDNGNAVENQQILHTSHFDAYMTGFVYASQLRSIPDGPGDWKHKLYLMGKPMPLLVRKSRYSPGSGWVKGLDRECKCLAK